MHGAHFVERPALPDQNVGVCKPFGGSSFNVKELPSAPDERDIASLAESCYTASIPDWTGVRGVLSAVSFFPGKVVPGNLLLPWNVEEKRKKGCNPKKIAALEILTGAEGETRTRTEIPPLDPEPSASTISATSATRMNMLPARDFVKTFLGAAIKKFYLLL